MLAGLPDSSFAPDTTVLVLNHVKDTAMGIVYEIDMKPPPDDGRVADALDAMRMAAEDIVDTVDAYLHSVIDPFGGG